MKKLHLILLSLSLLVLSLGAFAQIQNGQFTGTLPIPRARPREREGYRDQRLEPTFGHHHYWVNRAL